VAAGAGALGRFVDTALVTRNLEDKYRYSLETIYRYGKAPDIFGLIMNGPHASIDPDFNKTEIAPAGKYNNAHILNLLAEKPMRASQLQKAVEASIGMSSGTFYANYWPAVQATAGVKEDVKGVFSYTRPVPDTVTATS